MKRPQRKKTDEEIIKAILEEGKTDLFGILYDRYSDKVYRKCLSFVKNEPKAQDMAQDVLLKAFTQLAKFKGTSRFSTWLYSITYNYCVEQYRRSNRITQVDIDEGPDLADPEEIAEEELLEARADKLRKALERISVEDKMILLMKYQDDVSIRDLTEHLNISDSAVKMRLARARAKVRDLIQVAEEKEVPHG